MLVIVEEWKITKNQSNSYAVSNLGNVKNITSGRILVKHLNNAGYERVQLFIDGKIKKFFVHRLVAEYFVEGMADNLVVNHLDGNKLNNCAYNLEWCTRSENDKHAFRTGLRTPNVTVKFKHKILCTNIDNGEVLVFDNTLECAKYFNSSPSYIRECCNAIDKHNHIRFKKYYFEYLV